MLTDAGCWVLIARAATECFWMVLNYATNPLTENIDTSWQEATVRVQYDPEIANCWMILVGWVLMTKTQTHKALTSHHANTVWSWLIMFLAVQST